MPATGGMLECTHPQRESVDSDMCTLTAREVTPFQLAQIKLEEERDWLEGRGRFRRVLRGRRDGGGGWKVCTEVQEGFCFF